MPKIPVYESQLRPAGGATLDVSSPQTYMPFADATMDTGRVIEARGAKMLEDYDTTQAYAAFNQLRNTSRQKMNELLSREGAQAYGAQAEYKDFYTKAKEGVAKESITAFSQRSLYDKLAENHQSSDLDSLARHEYTEDKKNKVSQYKGYLAGEESSARDNAFNDRTLNNSIYGEFVPGPEGGNPVLKTPGVWQAIDHFHQGFDTEALKIEATQALRYAAADRLIVDDPAYATKKIEEWKSELGEKYAPLKKRLESQTKSDNLEKAYVAVTDKFGLNFEAASAYINNPKNWSALGGIKYEEAATLNTRINGLRAQREASESNAQEHMHRSQEATASQMIADLQTDDPIKRQQVLASAPEKLRKQQISIASYNAITKEITEGAKQDDLNALDELDAMAAVHDPLVSKRAIELHGQGRIKTTTADNYVKSGKDKEVGDGASYITTTMDPGLMGTPEARVAAGEARALYYQRLREPNPPKDKLALAKEIVGLYVKNTRRTITLTRRPQYMDSAGDMKNPQHVSQAMINTRNAYTQGLMGDPEDERVIKRYQTEMENADNLFQLALKSWRFDESSATSSEVQKGIEASKKAASKY